MARPARIDTFGVDLPAIRPHKRAMATLLAPSMALTSSHGSEEAGKARTIGIGRDGAQRHNRIKPALDTYRKQDHAMPAKASRLLAAFLKN